jgi:hypothetical protein
MLTFVDSMKTPLICLIAVMVAIAGCGPGKKDRARLKKPFIFKETIAMGADTGMANLGGFRRKDVRDVISQHWELPNMEAAPDIDLVLDDHGKRIFPELILFRDSGYIESPHSHFSIGTWQVTQEGNKLMLVLHANDQKGKTYLIQDVNSRYLHLGAYNSHGKLVYMLLSSDGLVHRNRLNDPFHPFNNQWRIKPAKPETDSAIAARARACVKFYALFYRDNIKRNKKEISFLGLPVIFEWYRRGIGLPDRDKVSDSWVECFYNEEQAQKGYDILRELIVRYEFKWPDNAPDWRYETRDVLEQMYNKLK